jgi:integrase
MRLAANAWFEPASTHLREKIYTLYVLRHQFAANSKAKYSREEVAILMGHTNVASNNKYYASKRHGHRKEYGENNTQADSYFEPSAENESSRAPGESA